MFLIFDWKSIQDQNKNPQHQSKKVEVQKVIIKSEGDDIKNAFELFDANDGKINTREIRTAMQNIGFDEKNPGVYEVMTELDNPETKIQVEPVLMIFVRLWTTEFQKEKLLKIKNFCQ